MKNLLLNENFLNKIVEQQEHDIYVHITALNNNEEPLDEIEGKITGGSINIDGDSAIRRTCSLTLVTDNININEFYWTKKTKFKLEIGLKNYLIGKYSTNYGYPDIIWFPQGIYLITTFSISLSTNNCNISISGKDKMSLLNGEFDGALFSSVDFGTEETIINNMIKTTNVNFKTALEGSYYIISQRNYINKENFRNQYIEDDPIFIYIPDTEDSEEKGNFYTENGVIFNKIINENELPEDGRKYTRYQIYELVKSIKNQNSLFTKVNFQEENYEQNKFYFKDEIEGYVLDSSKYKISNIIYYSLKDIYKRDLELVKEKVLIEKIIKEAVHTYAHEPYHKIIINDLDSQGLEKLIFKGDYAYIVYNHNHEVYGLYFPYQNTYLDKCITDDFSFYDPSHEEFESTSIYIDSDQNFTTNFHYAGSGEYKVRKIVYGEDVGYRLTGLTYAGDLIANIGETLTSILDKIKTMLGEFEYFYDINGNFVFQKKKNYLSTSWNQLNLTEDDFYIDFNKYKISYKFINSQLISNISSTPNLTNVKNDFSVWGKRPGLSGDDIPIHARYAIDKKPVYYQSLNKQIFFSKDVLQKKAFLITSSVEENSIMTPIAAQQNDLFEWSNGWWELNIWLNFCEKVLGLTIDEEKTIDQLFYLNDVYWENQLNELKKEEPNLTDSSYYKRLFFISFDEANKKIVDEKKAINEENKKRKTLSNYSVKNNTSGEYEYKNNDNIKYYIYSPLYSNYKTVDWREIIYQMSLDYFSAQEVSEKNQIFLGNQEQYLKIPDHFLYTIAQHNPEYYPTGKTGYEQYYTDLQGFWRQLYNPFYQTDEYYTLEESKDKYYWNKNIDYPETLDFWFDFVNVEDEYVELLKFSVPEIGIRSKVVNENKATSIAFKDIPNLVLYTDNIKTNDITTFSGDTFIKIPGSYSQYFSISSKSLSVKDKIDELLYQHSYCTENINISAVPMYHLQPNTRILIKDDKIGINGEYIINKITIPLAYNGTMSIQASKAPERLY